MSETAQNKSRFALKLAQKAFKSAPPQSLDKKRPALIREATQNDAEALRDFMRDIYTHERHLITRPDEFNPGLAQMKLWVKNKADNPLTLCSIALIDGQIAGMLDSWTDQRARIRHVTSFAMSVGRPFRRQGIGRQLLQSFCDHVRGHDILDKIELHVHSDNDIAYQLYTSLGFYKEGVRLEAIRYEDGRIVDDILMALWPKR